MVHAHVDYGFTETDGTRYNHPAGVTASIAKLICSPTEAMISYIVGEPI